MAAADETRIRLARSNWPYQPWQTLYGLKPVDFALERELRWFQLKFWLTGKLKMQVAFSRAARIFGAYFLQDEIDDVGSGSFVRRLKTVLKDRDATALVNHCFREGRLLRFSDERLWSEEVTWRSDRRDYLEFWMRLLRARLHLALEANDSRIGSAENYIRLKNHDVYSPESAEQHESIKFYKPKSVYFVAAHFAVPQMLDMKHEGATLIEDITNETPDEQTFRRYCGLLVAIRDKLGLKGANFIDGVVVLDPETLDLPNMGPVPQVILDDILNPGRRSARETRKGARQDPKRSLR